MRSLPEIKAMNAAVVDRNVSVHLRARQADIYEKALKRIVEKYFQWDGYDPATFRFVDVFETAQDALKRAGKLK